MSFQVVGLEIGLSEIRLVHLNKKINSLQLIQCQRHQLSSEHDILTVVKKIFSEQKIRPDLMVVGISSQHAVFRHLTLPFSDQNKILKVMKYEIESSLPFPSDQAVFSTQIHTPQAGDNSALFIGAVYKETITAFCRFFNEAGIDPQFIVLDYLALYNLYLSSSYAASSELVAIIDINEERILLIIVKGDQILLCRNISLPTECHQPITSLQPGDTIIEPTHHEDHPSAQSEQDQPALHAELLRQRVDNLIEKIDYTLHAFSSQNQVPGSIAKIFLIGQISLDKEWCAYFSKKLEIETVPFDPLQSLDKLEGREHFPEGQAALWAIPLGLTFELKRHRRSRVNLRQDELSYQRRYTQYKGMATVLSVLATFSIFLFLTNIHIQTDLYQQELSRINRKIKQISGQITTDNLKPYQEVTEAERFVKIEKEKYKTYGVLLQKSLTHLEMLKGLSIHIPQEVKVEFIDLSIDRNQIKIKGSADSVESVDKLKNSLQKVKKYAQTVVESINKEGGKKVDFRLSITTSDEV